MTHSYVTWLVHRERVRESDRQNSCTAMTYPCVTWLVHRRRERERDSKNSCASILFIWTNAKQCLRVIFFFGISHFHLESIIRIHFFYLVQTLPHIHTNTHSNTHTHTQTHTHSHKRTNLLEHNLSLSLSQTQHTNSLSLSNTLSVTHTSTHALSVTHTPTLSSAQRWALTLNRLEAILFSSMLSREVEKTLNDSMEFISTLNCFLCDYVFKLNHIR